MKHSCLMGTLIVASVIGASAPHGPPPPPPRQSVNIEMAAAARALLDSLSPELRDKASVDFDDKARQDWNFVPRTRPGVTLGELNSAQHAAVQDLLRSALSSQGVLKANAIIDLELVLRDIENGNAGRDPARYTIAIYGVPHAMSHLSGSTPSAAALDHKPWGWKIEGHHISLNFTSSGQLVTSVTPAFLGTSPASITSGPKAGQRILAAEEDLGRALLGMLDAEQRRTAIIAGTALPEVILGPGRGFDDAPAAGLPASAMTPAQRDALWRLIQEFAHNLRRELADSELKRIRDAGIDHIHFAWAGGDKPGQGHYYRLRGPTFVIEYDNTQQNANHVHTIWHDLTRNFSHDPLKEHYEHDHK